ncbi:hypothetical protein V6N11_024746 [Hibiscus sabdariffa]|uniref:RNase H type-1 domain-containing protein n=1 Tax=Hibiscus sabdariffa TaxID=183260 RepID=A0ABR2QN16_9ROSI
MARGEVLKTISFHRPIYPPSKWMPLEVEDLKFNVDGAVSGSFGLAAELLAIKEAGILFKSLKWARSHRLLVECDSNNIVHWIKNAHLSPASFRGIINSILDTFEGLVWQVFLISREQNSLADNLAKKGISITRGIVEFLLD